jgi:AraC-like DNA-binding protein
MELVIHTIPAGHPLHDYVDSFWMLHNTSGSTKEVIILPDGRVDLFFSRSSAQPYHVNLLGLGTRADEASIVPGALIFAASFKLPAVEYILHEDIATLADSGKNLPNNFWGFTDKDLQHFDQFCDKITSAITVRLSNDTDNRKLELFRLLYAANGSLSVKELSEKVFWSSRQVNRYFNQQFGVPLKTYSSILRFRASFGHIKEGKLFPREDFADQSHFIREVKRLSGVVPRELSRNINDRFIQFSSFSSE